MNLSDIFGFRVRGKSEGEQLPSVVTPNVNDGSIIIDQAVVAGGWQGYAYDPDSTLKTESDQIRRYREVSYLPEVESAIEDIVNEAIVTDQDDYPCRLELDNLKISDPLKKKFQDCFVEVLNLLDFNDRGHDVFRQWYVDARLYYHIIFRGDDIKSGIAEVRQIDPMKIKKVKNIKKSKNKQGIDVVTSVEEYYIYNDRGISDTATTAGIKLSNDSVVMIDSGLYDPVNNLVIGHLHKAIKPANQLRMLEDAIVIYTLTRAPDRRIFYIDVGNLPKIKAEQYVEDIKNKFKNKLVYNAATGEVADAKRHTSMIEDFWMPRRDGGKSTEITTLSGSNSLIQADFVEYFQNKLYQSLNVPINRMKPDAGFTLGRSQEITREELKFNKFVGRLRIKFSHLFHSLLRIQLISKGIIRADEWDAIRQKIRYDFIRDNHFSELKEAEIITNRMSTLQLVDPFLGKYYSKKWVQKHVLQMDDEEIDNIEKEIQSDVADNLPTELTNQRAMMDLQNDSEQGGDQDGA